MATASVRMTRSEGPGIRARVRTAIRHRIVQSANARSIAALRRKPCASNQANSALRICAVQASSLTRCVRSWDVAGGAGTRPSERYCGDPNFHELEPDRPVLEAARPAALRCLSSAASAAIGAGRFNHNVRFSDSRSTLSPVTNLLRLAEVDNLRSAGSAGSERSSPALAVPRRR
jgi:hypothetical protein